MKCRRCKKSIGKGEFCQTCKSELLFYYKATNDWSLAFDLELAQRSFFRFKNFGENYSEPGLT